MNKIRYESVPSVEVVRPPVSASMMLWGLAIPFLRALVLLWVLGAVYPQLHLGYWQAFVVAAGLRILLPGSEWQWWTRARKQIRR